MVGEKLFSEYISAVDTLQVRDLDELSCQPDNAIMQDRKASYHDQLKCSCSGIG